jgi:hypothetical protein
MTQTASMRVRQMPQPKAGFGRETGASAVGRAKLSAQELALFAVPESRELRGRWKMRRRLDSVVDLGFAC